MRLRISRSRLIHKVRWLTRGLVLSQSFERHDEIDIFLRELKSLFEQTLRQKQIHLDIGLLERYFFKFTSSKCENAGKECYRY